MQMRFGWALGIAMAGAMLAGCAQAPTVSPTGTSFVSDGAQAEADPLTALNFTKIAKGAQTAQIIGIGEVYAQKLLDAGVKNGRELLEAGKTKSGRDKLAKATDISGKLVLRWVNHCDLMRVTGAGPEYARLLELAGVDTVPELSYRHYATLRTQLEKANDLGGGKVAVHRLPSEKTTLKWVQNAMKMSRVVDY